MPNSIHLLGLLASAGLTACYVPSSCREVSRTAVTDPNAPLHVGGTLAELRATLGGTRSGPLRWLDTERHVSGFPPPGETEITVSITEPDVVWDLDYEPFNVQRNERLFCPDFVETELEIELETADGMLATSLVVDRAVFDGTSTANLWLDITDEDLGMLSWDPVDEDAELHLVLEYGFLTGPEGSLRYSFERSEDSGSGVGFMTELATWNLPNLDPERPR